MRRLHRFPPTLLAALALAAPGAALSQPAPPMLSSPTTVAPPAALQAMVLGCQLSHFMFGPDTARVTNLGTATLAPGRLISVVAVPTGTSVAHVALSATLLPGGSVDVTLTGFSTLARGCVASLG
jgi:hypothetical protein